ncbi:MAG: aminotransferase class I/II-fold pyridoxal phosphate-dependent enzyme [Gemmataceae bacterium]
MPVPFSMIKLLARTGLARFVPGIRAIVGDCTSVLRHISDRLLTTPLDTLSDLTDELNGHDDGCVDLASDAVSPICAVRPQNHISCDAAPTAGLLSLRQAIALKMECSTGINYDIEEEILVTHGVRDSLRMVLESFVNPGDHVVLLDPSPAIIVDELRHARAHVRWLPTKCEHGELILQPDQLLRAVAGAKMVCLNLSANPIGGRWRECDLEMVAQAAKQFDAFVVWHSEGERATVIPPDLHNRQLIIDQATDYVGWIGADKSLLKPCAISAMVSTSPVSPSEQIHAFDVLGSKPDVFPVALRRHVYRRLHSLGLEPIDANEGSYIWIDVRCYGIDGREFAEKLADTQNVLVAAGDRFGPSGTDFVRLTLRHEEKLLREGLRRISAFVHAIFPDRPELDNVDDFESGAGRNAA